MIIYSDRDLYQDTNRYHLNDITKALWNERTLVEREQVYGNWTSNFEYTPDIAKADIVLLTYKWNYYVDRGLIPQAMAEIENASRYGKKTVAFCGWDFSASLIHPDVLLFESGGYRSALGLTYHSGLPSFIKDYLQLYNQGKFQPRSKTNELIIGFCGQSAGSPIDFQYRRLRNAYENWQYRKGQRNWQPAPFETSAFRRDVLKVFQGKPGIRTNYVLRDKYHAGADSDKGDYSQQKLDFVGNILNSDYTVCIRGGGNFSIRFYETLALGRIPIFIDTDCLLPFHDCIPYRELFPWIEMKDLPRAPEIVADFHAQQTSDTFIELQHACRTLWKEHFTPNGFYADLRVKINELR